MNDDLISRRELLAYLHRRIDDLNTLRSKSTSLSSYGSYMDQIDTFYDVIAVVEDYEPADEADL